MIDVDFQFRAVGQGAFYTGLFSHVNGSKFSFVYDCGSESSSRYISKEIVNFSRSLEGESLDILFISHFHADHINKVKELLNHVNGIDKVIIPYLTSDEISLAITDKVVSGDLDEDLTSFITNPVLYLGEKVKEVFFVHTDDNETSTEEEIPNDPISPEEIENFDFKFIINENGNIPSDNPKVKHCYASSVGYLRGLWKFKMFNKPRDKSTVSSFISDLKALIKGNPSFKNLSNFISTDPKSNNILIHKLYEKHFGFGQKINETSLVVYHASLHNICLLHNYRRKWIHEELNGTILTGDIIMDQATLDQMEKKWNSKNWRFDILVFQIPHHGSKNNTKFNLLNLPTVRWWVVNFGLGNKHKHPHQQTIDHIEHTKGHGIIYCNTQLQKFRYGGKII